MADPALGRQVVAAVDRLRRGVAGDLGDVAPAAPLSTLQDARDVSRGIVDDLVAALDGAETRCRPELLRLLARADRLEDRVRRARSAGSVRRREAVDRAIGELRTAATTGELLADAARLVLLACEARRVTLGRIRDEVWSPWLTATDGDDDEHRPGRRMPQALDDLPLERRVVRSGRAVRDAGTVEEDGRPLVAVLAPVHVDGAVLAVLEVRIPASEADTGTDPDVERLAGALGRAFSVLAVRDRAGAQARATAELRGALLEGPQPGDGAATELPAAELGAPPATGDRTVERSALTAALTPRQRETLELMAVGLSNAEIADRLVVGVPTVKSHVTAILRAAGALNRGEAIRRHLDDRPAARGSGGAARS